MASAISNVSDSGINLLTKLEGYRLTAYQDSDKKWTIGYGHTGPEVVPGLTITSAQAKAYLASDLATFANGVASAISYPVNQNQFDALVIFAYNIGLSAFKGSTALKMVNSGNFDAVPDAMSKFNMVGNQVNNGLVNRRSAEVALWKAPVGSNGITAPYSTTDIISSDGKSVTTVVSDNGGNKLSEATLNYTDSSQSTLASVRSVTYNLGATTTTTVIYDPTNLGASPLVTTQTYQKFDDGSSMTTTVNPNGSKVIESLSADGKTKTISTDSNNDTIIDDVQTTTTLANGITVTKDNVGNNNTIDSEYVSYNGQQYSLSDKTQTIAVDNIMSGLYSQHAIGSADYLGFSYDVSAALTSFGSNPALPSNFSAPISQDPIGAFYEAKSAALDKALSIANQTGVLIGSNNKGLTSASLQAMDANKDGKLSGTELAGLQVWTDSNENGTLDAGELKTLAAAGINQINSTVTAFTLKAIAFGLTRKALLLLKLIWCKVCLQVTIAPYAIPITAIWLIAINGLILERTKSRLIIPIALSSLAQTVTIVLMRTTTPLTGLTLITAYSPTLKPVAAMM